MSGVKGELVVKAFGNDLKVLTRIGTEIKEAMSKIPGIEDLGSYAKPGSA
jgi:cobalt-zinc-cadmium resistance protein CzcA